MFEGKDSGSCNQNIKNTKYIVPQSKEMSQRPGLGMPRKLSLEKDNLTNNEKVK